MKAVRCLLIISCLIAISLSKFETITLKSTAGKEAVVTEDYVRYSGQDLKRSYTSRCSFLFSDEDEDNAIKTIILKKYSLDHISKTYYVQLNPCEGHGRQYISTSEDLHKLYKLAILKSDEIKIKENLRSLLFNRHSDLGDSIGIEKHEVYITPTNLEFNVPDDFDGELPQFLKKVDKKKHIKKEINGKELHESAIYEIPVSEVYGIMKEEAKGYVKFTFFFTKEFKSERLSTKHAYWVIIEGQDIVVDVVEALCEYKHMNCIGFDEDSSDALVYLE
jgi:hypothetical protein